MMITSDSTPRTAGRSGVRRENRLRRLAVEGRMLEGIDDDEIVGRGPSTFAPRGTRPTSWRLPSRRLQAPARGEHRVGMTSKTPGVNDAPALDGPDVGIAMGAAARTSHATRPTWCLLDDNLRRSWRTIEEGRRIAANIKKFLDYLLTRQPCQGHRHPRRVAVRHAAHARRSRSCGSTWCDRQSGQPSRWPSISPSPRLMDHPPRRGADDRPRHACARRRHGICRRGHRPCHLLPVGLALLELSSGLPRDTDLHRPRGAGVPPAWS